MRRGNRGTSRHQSDENWTPKPLNPHQHQQQREFTIDQSHQAPSVSSSQLHPEPKPKGNLKPAHQPKGQSRDRRRNDATKKQFVPKSSQLDASKSNSYVDNLDSRLDSSKSEPDLLNSDVGVASCGERVSGEREINEEIDNLEVVKEESEDVKGDGEVDVLRRLEALRLDAEEPKLSDERLRINDQLQEDELLVMESIYGNDSFVCSRQNGQRSFQMNVHAEAPSELTITAQLNSYGDPKIESKGSDDFSYSFKLQYLPPIVFNCLLPESYPSNRPPYFTISVQWLNSARISSLCSMLDSIWMEQQGQEVLYRWVDWLHNSSLLYLGFEEEIVLGPYGKKHNGDKRAISRSVSPDADIPSMRSYNEEQVLVNFLKSLHECQICYSEYTGSDFVRLPCQHFFCWKCMKTYSDMHVAEGTVNKLQCPESKCQGMIPPSLLKRLLDNEEFERWEQLMLQKTLDSMSDVTYCPRCETPCIEDEDNYAQCSKCFYSFCTLCRDKSHVGVQCLTPEIRLRILEERQNSSHVEGNQKQKEKEMINELLSLREVSRDAKQCPSCKMAISRTEGCNKMICSNCGTKFCYRCNKEIDGYEHFRGGDCELFPQEAIQQWEERINARQVVGQIHANVYANHAHPCPNCGQPNAKVNNNNYVFCWACQMHHCYLCRKVVRRFTQHFGAKGCKQHTVG